jgi:hypothetical protein
MLVRACKKPDIGGNQNGVRATALSIPGKPMNSIKAGVAYFAIIFSLGFVLGTLRVLVIIPRIGEFAATLLELPFILAASWLVSGWLINRLQVAPQTRARLLMGAVAFGLTMVAEPLLGLAFGRSLAEQWPALQQPAGIAGLAGQAAFALIPWIRLKTR